MEENNPYAFISTDLIVWNGIISHYGSVSHLVDRDDKIKIANEEEEKQYKETNRNKL